MVDASVKQYGKVCLTAVRPFILSFVWFASQKPVCVCVFWQNALRNGTRQNWTSTFIMQQLQVCNRLNLNECRSFILHSCESPSKNALLIRKWDFDGKTYFVCSYVSWNTTQIIRNSILNTLHLQSQGKKYFGNYWETQTRFILTSNQHVLRNIFIFGAVASNWTWVREFIHELITF